MIKKAFFIQIILFVLLLHQSAFAGGVTIITHGYQIAGIMSSPAIWVDTMAEEIKNRSASPQNASIYKLKLNLDGNLEVNTELTHISGPLHGENTQNGETVIIVDWTDLSTLLVQIDTPEIGNYLSAYFSNTLINGHIITEQPLHLIGHSRGGSLVSQIAGWLGLRGIWVDQVTTLDPHPALGDPDAYIYENVLFADNYRQVNYISDNTDFDPSGFEVSGAYSRKLNNLSGEGYIIEHSDVHLWYHGTIDTGTDASDGEQIISPFMRVGAEWWTSEEKQGKEAGFFYSRLGGGDRLNTYSANDESNRVVDGFHYMYGGDGSRIVLDWSSANWPNIIKVELFNNETPLSGDTATVHIGETINFEYVGQDYDSESDITLYLDVDRNPYNDNNIITSSIGDDNHSATGQGYFTNTIEIDTSYFPEASGYIYAQITDGSHTRYMYARTKLDFVSYKGLPWLMLLLDDSAPDLAFGTVVSASGRIWMDRNLGASRVATSPTDELAYGDLYQWGRGPDGHQLRTSYTTWTNSTTDVPGHGLFIKEDSSPYDWRVPQNNNLWQGVSGANNPCPAGFRLPTYIELYTDDSSLELVWAGTRHPWDGNFYQVGSHGYYWSSTILDTKAHYVPYAPSGTVCSGIRGCGMSVRCIMD